MSEASNRRRQQLLDKFLAGEVEKATYDSLLHELNRLEGDVVPVSTPGPISSVSPLGAGEVRVTPTVSPPRGGLPAAIHGIVEPGVELNGFRIEKRIGRGGMGEVWQAIDVVGERHVVIKCLPFELSNHPQEMAGIKQMFHRVHDLQHQNICPLYLLGQDPRFGYFLVMKHIEGMTLDQYRTAYVKKTGSFTIKDVARVLIPIAKALDHAHQQKIVHRDVKPTNIMVSADGQSVQLVDFGLAAEIRGSLTRLSKTGGEVAGTYPYMAPEQWRAELVDGQADQYALAVVAYEMLAGRRPFDSPDPTILRLCALNDAPPPIAGVDPEVNAALKCGLAKQRAERFPNCVEFMKALCQSVLAKPAGPATNAPTNSATAPLAVPRSVAPAALPRDPQMSITETHKSSAVASPVSAKPQPVKPSAHLSPAKTASLPPATGRPAPPQPVPNKSASSQAPLPPRGRIAASEIELLDDDDDDTPYALQAPRSLATKPTRGSPRGDKPLKREESNDYRQLFVVAGITASSLVLGALLIWGVVSLVKGVSKEVAQNSSDGVQHFGGDGGSTGNGGSDAGSGGSSSGGSAGSGGANGGRPTPPPVRYRWTPGISHTYAVSVELDQGTDAVVQMTGNLTYQVQGKVAPAVKQERVGTGTGFVVSSDGYLLTCHHVTEGASQIEVALGKKTYPATLIADNEDHDIALIKIEATGLTTVPLANSDLVKLGEDVRAIGYPLSSILGSNIKTTRGTISGINDDDEMGRVFQIDASINPGNSGGPLFNEQGQVVGINFAKLIEVGEGVGFAVPINHAKSMLQSCGVAFTEKTGGADLKGADLITLVEPATALITVTSDGSGAATVSLRCDNKLTTRLVRKDGSIDPSYDLGRARRAMFSSLRARQVPAEADTDDRGEIHDVRGDNALPNFLGSIPQLIVERLPSRGEPTWGYSHPVTFVITKANSMSSGGPFGGPPGFGGPDFGAPPGFGGPRFGPRGFPGFPGRNQEPESEEFPGNLKVSYRRGEQAGPLLTIHKTYDLQARQTIGAGPRIQLQGNGIFRLDMTTGLPESYEFTGTLTENEVKVSTKTPIKVTYKLTQSAATSVPVPVPATQTPAQPPDKGFGQPSEGGFGSK